jgi:hypothetical protein
MAIAAEKRFKIWKAHADDDAGFMVTPKEAYLIGNKQNFVVADETGVALNGSISFNTLSEQTRRGGLFIGMNDFALMIPSTLLTVRPQQIPFPPIAFPISIGRDLPVLLAALV